MDRPNELCVFFFHGAVLVAELGENLRKCRQADAELGLERQHDKRQVGGACQGAEVLQRVREGRAPGSQSQTTAAARTVHLLQGNPESRKLGKIEAFIQIIGWIVLNVVVQASQIKNGIESI